MPTVPVKGSVEAQDYLACRALIRQGSRTFFAASLLLPESVRLPACVLYAFCRLSDDAVDQPGAKANAVTTLTERLDRAYAGTPAETSADRAFADVVARFRVPKALPLALLDGLRWDQEGRRFETLSDLRAYAARVAGSVGAMMTVLMGVRDPVTLARACDLGVAMQFTNIARDIGEDARNDRFYLPLDWCREADFDVEAFLADPRPNLVLALLVERLLAEADGLYRRSEAGIAALPLSCRPAIHAARIIYREIGREVRRAGLDSVSRRAIVTDRRKLALVAGAFAATGWGAGRDATPALAETAFLVEAVSADSDDGRSTAGDRESLDDRIGWVIDLFGRLNARDAGSGEANAAMLGGMKPARLGP